MKKGHDKTRYFRKDYAPARAAAMQSRQALQKSSRQHRRSNITTPSSHSTRKNAFKTAAVKTKKLANQASKSAQQLAHRLSHQANQFCKQAHAKTAQHQTTHRTKAKTSKRRQPLTWSERTLLSLIGVSAAMIALTFILTSIFDPVARSERELTKLAEAYYIEYLYPYSLGQYLDRPEVILADYTNRGLPNVRLRQLLLYDNGKYSSSIDAFSNEYYECDTNKSYVRYYPVAPYGPRDFTVHYGPVCEKLVGDE